MAGRNARNLKALCAVLLVALAVESMWLAYPWLRSFVVRPEESDVARGRRLAEELGCFNCHGPGGKGGVPNPGSEWETVPAYREGAPMMFAKSDAALREYILDGAPAAKRERPAYRDEMAAQAIRMPAFGGWVSEADVDALAAFVRAASGLLKPADQQLRRGAELARANGCFACHGDMGSGGLPNPGSFKGYIPGFIRRDFADLVRSDDELREWIAEGSIARLRNNPLAAHFLDRQRIQMPAYKKFLSAEEMDALGAYVRWLASGTWRTQPLSE